jgi:putative flippase GtrA
LVSFIRYLFAAGIATIVDVAIVQFLLSSGASGQPMLLGWAIFAGACAGIVINFGLSRRFVFAPDGRHISSQFRTFLVVSASTAALRITVAYMLVAILALPLFGALAALPVTSPVERIAHLGAVGLVTIYSFLAHRNLSFAGGIRSRLPRRSPMVP